MRSPDRIDRRRLGQETEPNVTTEPKAVLESVRRGLPTTPTPRSGDRGEHYHYVESGSFAQNRCTNVAA